jgi:hypothetical protein
MASVDGKDFPLHAGAGRIIDELIVSMGISPVIDLGQMPSVCRPWRCPVLMTAKASPRR